MGTRNGRRAAAEASNERGWTAYLQGLDASKGLLASVVPDRDEAVPHHTGPVYRLHGIAYDARADAIGIEVGEPAAGTPFLRYFVAAPRSVKIDKLSEVTTIEILDARGERTHVYVYPESVTPAPNEAGTTRSERDEAGE